MNIEYIKIKDLIPYERNPRNNEISVDAVANSIRKFGFMNPIIIDRNNVIVCGHTRLKAAKKLNLVEVPCLRADDISDEDIKAFRLVDNKTGELATWKNKLLDEELAEICRIDMSMFGFPEETKVDIEQNSEDVAEVEKMVKCPHCGKMVLAKKIKITHGNN